MRDQERFWTWVLSFALLFFCWSALGEFFTWRFAALYSAACVLSGIGVGLTKRE